MGIVTGIEFHLAGGTVNFSEKEAADLKSKYIAELTGSSDTNQVADNNSSYLSEQSLETLQSLYLDLRHVFTHACSDDDRLRIVKSLLGVAQNDWAKILTQVCFITPLGTDGKDIAQVTEILVSVKNATYRDQLVLTANRLFKYDTLTIERANILSSLSKLNSEELSNLDKAEEKDHEEFIKKCGSQIAQNKSSVPVTSLKRYQYLEKLILPINQHDNSVYAYSDLTSHLNNQPPAKLRSIYLALKDIFTPACLNDDRLAIIKSLCHVDEKEWPTLLKQVCFIMPHGTLGKDIAYAIGILSSCKDLSYRKQLVHTANRLFKEDTLTIKRYYILDALANLNSEELSKLDKAEEKVREEFVKKVVPECLKKGDVIASRFDPVLNKG